MQYIRGGVTSVIYPSGSFPIVVLCPTIGTAATPLELEMMRLCGIADDEQSEYKKQYTAWATPAGSDMYAVFSRCHVPKELHGLNGSHPVATSVDLQRLAKIVTPLEMIRDKHPEQTGVVRVIGNEVAGRHNTLAMIDGICGTFNFELQVYIDDGGVMEVQP